MSWRIVFVLPLLLALQACVNTDRIAGTIVTRGVYYLSKDTEVVVTPQAPSGKSTLAYDPPILKEDTDRIPATIGTRFGMWYEISNIPCSDGWIEVTKVTRHPIIQKPDGTTSTEFSFTQKQLVHDGKITWYTGYIFDQPYEAVPGEWNVEIFIFGKSVLKQQFHVYTPGSISIAQPSVPADRLRRPLN